MAPVDGPRGMVRPQVAIRLMSIALLGFINHSIAKPSNKLGFPSNSSSKSIRFYLYYALDREILQKLAAVDTKLLSKRLHERIVNRPWFAGKVVS